MVFRSPLPATVVVALLATVPTCAQTAAPKPAPTTIPEKIAPGAEPSAPTKNLSKELNQSGGVIHPKDVDPAMNKGAPNTSDQGVIKPPASGDAEPQAK
jgi:hypothetical protein